jgi:hypothetical protein
MADTYRGPATIIVDRVETTVFADLMRHDEFDDGWLGVLDADLVADFDALTAGRTARIRLPCGREGDLGPDRTALGTARVAVVGSGAAPF